MNTIALLAEFIGTFTVIFISVGAIACDVMSGHMLGLTGIALAYGISVAVMVSATVEISGGHLNPAVTFGAFLARKIDVLNGIAYILAQCLGAVAGAYVIRLTIPQPALIAITYGTPVVTRGATVSQAFFTEVVLTFFLVFVVFGTAMDKRAPRIGGLYIGLTVAMGVMMGAAVSGAAMNPARFLGPAIAGGGLDNAWLYLAGPLVGGALAALLYKYVFEENVAPH